jgi:hypothetical protein
MRSTIRAVEWCPHGRALRVAPCPPRGLALLGAALRCGRAPTVAHVVSLPAPAGRHAARGSASKGCPNPLKRIWSRSLQPRGGCVPRLQACSAGLDGTQKGCVSQPGACGPAKPVPRPLLGWGTNLMANDYLRGCVVPSDCSSTKTSISRSRYCGTCICG